VATALGRSELIDDPRFGTEKDRVANIDAVDDEVSSVTSTRTAAELVAICRPPVCRVRRSSRSVRSTPTST
jgi:crotonobetainyl-CoA:carnitine CoA-transferase CaiB-like acyl-CoA transferase